MLGLLWTVFPTSVYVFLCGYRKAVRTIIDEIACSNL